MATYIDQILETKKRELDQTKKTVPLARLKEAVSQGPFSVRSFRDAIASDFGLIAEIKRRSPSMGEMRSENFDAAVGCYERSPAVKSISVLTDATYFGMSMEILRQIREKTTKPLLRKDFIFDPYQVYEAHAYGADAILLMVSVLKETEPMRELHALARELGMDVLFEAHSKEEIDRIPEEAEIYGLNSRKFTRESGRGGSSKRVFGWSRLKSKLARAFGRQIDFSTDLSVFELAKHLPEGKIKVAESGIKAANIAEVRDKGFHAALVGTSLLTDPRGVEEGLGDFEEAMQPAGADTPVSSSHPGRG